MTSKGRKLKNDIGRKIKMFRTRVKMTQLDLENQLNLSTGSLTKIESGKVTPSRETLLRIIEQLNLNAGESFLLLGLPSSKLTEIIDLISEINLLKTELEIAQRAVNEIPKKLGLLGASLNIVQGDKIQTIAITQSWYSDLVVQTLPFSPVSFNVSLNKDKHNLLVQSVLENKRIYGEQLAPFTAPFMPVKLSNLIQRVVGVRSLLSVPMIIDSKPIGVVLYVKNQKMGFEEEIPLLESLTKSIASVLYRL